MVNNDLLLLVPQTRMCKKGDMSGDKNHIIDMRETIRRELKVHEEKLKTNGRNEVHASIKHRPIINPFN